MSSGMLFKCWINTAGVSSFLSGVVGWAWLFGEDAPDGLRSLF